MGPEREAPARYRPDGISLPKAGSSKGYYFAMPAAECISSMMKGGKSNAPPSGVEEGSC